MTVSAVTIRWHGPDHLTVLVDGEPAVSADNATLYSDDDLYLDETPLSVTRVAAEVAADTARALGATVTIERTER